MTRTIAIDSQRVKIVGRCEELLWTGKFAVESNDVATKFRNAGAGTPKKAPGVRKTPFEFFTDFRSSRKARLPKKIFLGKAESLYHDYCECERLEGIELEKLALSNQWLLNWCKES